MRDFQCATEGIEVRYTYLYPPEQEQMKLIIYRLFFLYSWLLMSSSHIVPARPCLMTQKKCGATP